MEQTNMLGEKNKRTETIKPKVVYTIEETELRKIEVSPNIFLRVIKTSENTYVDIRKYYKGYPTKRGIRFKLDVFDSIKDILSDIKDI